MNNLTKQDARAISKSIWRNLLNKYNTGFPNYGWDWPTLRVLFPDAASVLKECYRIIQKEPNRDRNDLHR